MRVEVNPLLLALLLIAPILRYGYGASLMVEDHAMVPYSYLSIYLLPAL